MCHSHFEKSIRIKFSATPEVFANCVSPVMSTTGAFEKAVNGTAMAGLVLDIKVQTFEWILIKIQMPFYQFLSNEYCRAGKCLRDLRQSRTGPAELVETDQSGIDENSGKIKHCYNDHDGDNANDYQYSGQCGTNYFCAAPGKRHGHSTVSVLIQGDNMLLLIGGESGDWTADIQSLTMDVHVSYFSALYGTWAHSTHSNVHKTACSWKTSAKNHAEKQIIQEPSLGTEDRIQPVSVADAALLRLESESESVSVATTQPRHLSAGTGASLTGPTASPTPETRPATVESPLAEIRSDAALQVPSDQIPIPVPAFSSFAAPASFLSSAGAADGKSRSDKKEAGAADGDDSHQLFHLVWHLGL
jgi:hypothetical protein